MARPQAPHVKVEHLGARAPGLDARANGVSSALSSCESSSVRPALRARPMDQCAITCRAEDADHRVHPYPAEEAPGDAAPMMASTEVSASASTCR